MNKQVTLDKGAVNINVNEGEQKLTAMTVISMTPLTSSLTLIINRLT